VVASANGAALWSAVGESRKSPEKLPILKIFKLLSIRVKTHMHLIRNVVQQALSTGYLTIEAEEQLREMLCKKYDREDLKAFMRLQQAAMAGHVKQQSRELVQS
jgi:flagellar biosynthesis protein FliP